MQLQGLSLQHFRNHTQRTLLFTQPTTLIYAPNTTGKTNVLEALHLLSLGESFRSHLNQDLIQFGQTIARAKCKIHHHKEDTELEIVITKDQTASGERVKKLFFVNGVARQRKNFVGHFPTVSFIPEDLTIVSGTPSHRREFLNILGSQLDQEYLRALTMYEQTLRRRNKLLDQIRDGRVMRTALQFYDMTLIKHGSYLQEFRQKLIDQLNQVDFPWTFQLSYDISVISEQRLQQYSQEEIIVGHTLVGPHKDDVKVSYKPQNSPVSPLQPVAQFGSRGQQRLAVLWLKLGSFELLKKKYGFPPLLLLDDIFSELDEKNRSLLFTAIEQTQSIITTSEDDVFSLLQSPTIEKINL